MCMLPSVIPNFAIVDYRSLHGHKLDALTATSSVLFSLAHSDKRFFAATIISGWLIH